MQMQYSCGITDYLVQISYDVRGDLERAEEGEEDAEEDIETGDDEGGHDGAVASLTRHTGPRSIDLADRRAAASLPAALCCAGILAWRKQPRRRQGLSYCNNTTDRWQYQIDG